MTHLAINGNCLQPVDSWLPFGHLSNHDLDQKRREMIVKIHFLQQELGPQDLTVFLVLRATFVLMPAIGHFRKTYRKTVGHMR